MSKPVESQYPMPGYPPYPYLSEDPRDEISLLDLWDVLMDYKWSIMAICVITVAMATAVALYMKPVYRAQALLVTAGDEGKAGMGGLAQLGGLASMVGISIGSGGSNTDQQLATLTSRAFLDGFIKDEKLLPILFAKRWNSKTASWQLEEGQKPPTALDAYTVLTKGIVSTSVDKKSGLITLAVEWGDPQQAAQWANKLVKRFNEYQRQIAIEQSNRNIRYLEQQIQKTSVLEVQKMFYSLIENELKSMMMANVRQEFALKVIDPAQPPEKKIKPKRALIVMLGAAAGLMLGVFAAFFRNFLRKQRAEREKITASHDKEAP